MNNKPFILLLMALFTSISTQAQSISKQINDVKRSDAYLSAEATLETKEKALALAHELLAQQIEEYAATQQQLKQAPNVIVKDVASKAQLLQMKRGEMVRVFLYVKKTDIIAANNTQVLVQPSNPPQQHQFTPPTPLNSWQQQAINDLQACPNVNLLQEKLGQLRSQRKVKRFGAPDTCRRPDEAYWAILDAEGNLVTILAPASQGQRTNLRTGQNDTLANYQGMGAIWFTMR